MAEEEKPGSSGWSIGPSVEVGAPEEYPTPKAGPATRWILATPESAPVGVIIFNDGGLLWTPASGGDLDAQEYASELLNYIRGHRAADIPQADMLAGVQEAYADDLTEDSVKFVPAR